MSPFAIEPLEDSPQIRSALGQLLVETVAGGGSVSFMHPLPQRAAEAFWKDSLASAARGERIVLGAFDGSALIGPSRCCSTCRPTSRTGRKSQR